MHSATIDKEYTSSSSSAEERTSNSSHTNENKYQFVSLTKDESLFLNKKRKSWKLANPKGLYTFRDQPIGIFSCMLHVATFLVCAFLFIFYLYLPHDKELINGIGSYSNITPLERFARTLLVGLILFNLNSLKVNLKAYPIKRYWFAMASNSLFQAVLLNIYYCLFSILCIAFVGAAQGIDLFSVFEIFEESANYEIFLIIDTFISAGIILYAFRFCRKGLKQ